MWTVRWTCLLLALASACADKDGDACKRESAFTNAHRACAKHEDCVIVGSCSGGFGFAAVQRSAQAKAQALSDDTACEPWFDGPTYAAVCEQGTCHQRLTGSVCGAPSSDGGLYGCPPSQEQYATECGVYPTGGFASTGCETHCDGADDTRCGAGLSCKSVKVVGLGAPCTLIDVWLCRPAS